MEDLMDSTVLALLAALLALLTLLALIAVVRALFRAIGQAGACFRTVIIAEYERGLLYENGAFVKMLDPGRYRAVSLPWLRRDVTRIDTRRTVLNINGQEMLTADALSVRLNVVAEYRIVDAAVAINTVEDYRTAIYTAVQILLRNEVQARTIDALLADRTALSETLREQARPEAAALGLEITMVGVKDIILPGDVKKMLTQEIEALRAGRAALVAAREETAAARARANTAQIMGSNPVLLRLREIEALTECADGAGNTIIVALPQGPLPGA